MKRFFQIAGTVLLIGLIVICIPFTLPRLFGYQIYEVITDSMTPEYPVGSVIYVKETEPESIEVGDVITFSIGTDTSQVMTHRVTAIDSQEQTFTTKGDANESEDLSPVAFQRLMGVPKFKIPHMGGLTRLFSSTEGRILLGCLLGLVFLLWFASDHMKQEPGKHTEFSEQEKPQSGRGRGSTVLLLAGVALIVFAVWNIYHVSSDYKASNTLYTTLNENYVTSEPIGEQEKGADWSNVVQVDLVSLKKINPDVVGWIVFENEDISYPLMYSGDDSTYLHTAMDGSYAAAGSIFMEGGNNPDLSDCHTIIYGHNMRNLSMFGKLRYYKNDADYYREHAFFQIHTEQGIYRYQIFAYSEVPADSFVYHVPYAADDSFGEFIQKLYAQSLQDTGVTATKEDHILTLSTCSSTGTRLVVHAVLVDER